MRKEYAKNEVVLMAFLQYTKSTEIARAAGISRTTVYRLEKDADFQNALNDRRRQLQKAAVGQLSANLEKNLSTLQRIADDAETSPQVRINAIQLLLRQHDSWTERLDVLEELAELREAVDRLNQ